MKKALLFILVMTMCLSMAACKGTSQNGNGTNNGENPVTTARPGYEMWSSGRTTAAAVQERKTESYTPEAGTAEQFTVANYFSDRYDRSKRERNRCLGYCSGIAER